MQMRCALLLIWLTQAAYAAPGIEPRDGDRIVLVGDGLMERMQKVGQFEARLRAAHPQRRFVVRNLGWSGDTVTGMSRCYFDAPAEGYKRLVEQVKAQRPTILILAYGTSDSFAGPGGLERFRHDYAKLLRDAASGVRRIVLVGPMPQQALPAPFPDPVARNAVLAAYNQAIRELAAKRGDGFVDLIAAAKSPEIDLRMTTRSGIDYDEDGYRFIDGQLLRAFARPAAIRNSGKDPAFNEIVEMIRWKDSLFFQRYRPLNITYLTGFRKYEQGQNAKDLDELDRLIANQEDKITARVRAAFAGGATSL